MLINELLKQPLPTNLPIKSKSNYAKQYEEFQKRLSRNRMRTKLPTLHPRNLYHSSHHQIKTQEYLDLAKRLIENKQQIYFPADHQNEVSQFQLNHDRTQPFIEPYQHKIIKLKTRNSQDNQYKEVHTLEDSQYYAKYSQQIQHMHPRQNLNGASQKSARSRAMSNVGGNVLKERDMNEVNFLVYKKVRKEAMPSLFKND